MLSNEWLNYQSWCRLAIRPALGPELAATVSSGLPPDEFAMAMLEEEAGRGIRLAIQHWLLTGKWPTLPLEVRQLLAMRLSLALHSIQELAETWWPCPADDVQARVLAIMLLDPWEEGGRETTRDEIGRVCMALALG